ncbi:uncharacterized protein LOC116199284 isoform X5 [Punica granatum]|uniref:Uncharacterized protein LOC116199284 isoform X5 n=1 Tax=Punica granatum TaxID=22663 RepID=A0A6P8CMG0_PUNGR|nr:uncharacterized protein LOC116199284 isoform X5 [Punica granatum]
MSTDKGYGQPFAPRLVSTAMGTKEKAEGLLEHTVIAICDSPTPMASPGTGRDQQLRPTCYKQGSAQTRSVSGLAELPRMYSNHHA